MSTDVKAMCERLVRERGGSLLATPEGRQKLTAYLDGLDRTHAHDPAMRDYVQRQRKLIAERERAAPCPPAT